MSACTRKIWLPQGAKTTARTKLHAANACHCWVGGVRSLQCSMKGMLEIIRRDYRYPTYKANGVKAGTASTRQEDSKVPVQR